MIPRLPPLLLVAIGSATVYGIKVILDKTEPKALGPPGSSQRVELKYRLRQRARYAGYATAAAGILYAGYWAYKSHLDRSTPSSISGNPNESNEFYQDQYSSRDSHQMKETLKARKLQQEREQDSRRRLETEQAEMKKTIIGR